MDDHGLVYQPMSVVPQDRAVTLILRDDSGVYPTIAPFCWNGSRWVSTWSGLALSSSVQMIGWREAPAEVGGDNNGR